MGSPTGSSPCPGQEQPGQQSQGSRSGSAAALTCNWHRGVAKCSREGCWLISLFSKTAFQEQLGDLGKARVRQGCHYLIRPANGAGKHKPEHAALRSSFGSVSPWRGTGTPEPGKPPRRQPSTCPAPGPATAPRAHPEGRGKWLLQRPWGVGWLGTPSVPGCGRAISRTLPLPQSLLLFLSWVGNGNPASFLL